MTAGTRWTGRAVVGGVSMVSIGMFLAVALLRLSYPFDLEWMEGGSVDHVVRVLAGQPLYVAPQVTFIPYEYPPLYFWLSAAVARLTGVGYLPLRLVSLVSTLAVFWCLARLVLEETGRWLPGLLAAGLYAATFRASGAWFDLARVDSLLLALFLWGLVIIRTRRSQAGHVWAGLIWTAAFLTKQPALAMAAPVVLHEVVFAWRRGVWLAATLVLGVGLTSWGLHLATDGWFTFYVWAYPFKHAFTDRAAWTFWTTDLLAPLPIATLAAVALLVRLGLQRQRSAWFWTAAAVGLIGAAFRSRLQSGGYDNVLMPAYAAVALLAAMLVHHEWAIAERAPEEQEPGRTWRGALATTLCVLQCGWLAYAPRPLVPSEADRRANAAMQARLGRVAGPVLLPYHGYYSTAAGKGMTAHLMQVYDILKVGDAHSAELAAQFRRAIRAQAFGAIVLDDTRVYYFMDAVNEAYEKRETLFEQAGVGLPVTGGIVARPELLYLPRVRPEAEAGRLATEVLQERLSGQRVVPPTGVIE